LVEIDLYGQCVNPKLNGETPAALRTKRGGYRWERTSVFRASVSMADIEAKFTDRMEREDDHTVPLDEAHPQAADDTGLCFKTGPAFGCVHFEAPLLPDVTTQPLEEQ